MGIPWNECGRSVLAEQIRLDKRVEDVNTRMEQHVRDIYRHCEQCRKECAFHSELRELEESVATKVQVAIELRKKEVTKEINDAIERAVTAGISRSLARILVTLIFLQFGAIGGLAWMLFTHMSK